MSLATSGPTGARTRIHGGFRGSGPSTGMTLTGLRAVLLAPDWAVGCVDVDMGASMRAKTCSYKWAERHTGSG